MNNSLEAYRLKIDEIDRDLAVLLARRFAVVDCISAYKRNNGVGIRNEAREKLVADRAADLAGAAYGEDVRKVYESLFAVSRARQEKMIQDEKNL